MTRKQLKTIDPIDNGIVHCELVHEGIEGQKAWGVHRSYNYKYFYVEIVVYLDGRHAYHVERNERFVSDSRLATTYYDSFDECYRNAVNSIYSYIRNKK